MKLGPVTKLEKRNKTSKTIDNDVMLANCDVIVIFPIYSQFGASRKSHSRRIVCKSYIFVKSNLYLTKTENRSKKSLARVSHYCFE